MKHLKLGMYSFVIDVNDLGLTPGASKNFSRDELPDALKPLYDIVQSGLNKSIEKPIFVNVIDKNNEYYYSGFLLQSGGTFTIELADGMLFEVLQDTNVITITIYEY